MNFRKAKIMICGGLLIPSLFLIMFLEGGTYNNLDYFNQTKSIHLSNENLNSIKKNSREDDVIHIFGRPYQVQVLKQPKSEYFMYSESKNHEDIDFQIVKSKVDKISFSNNRYYTVKGITVGSSKAALTQAYEEHYYSSRKDTLANTVGSSDNLHKINIKFAFHNNKVVGIILSKITI